MNKLLNFEQNSWNKLENIIGKGSHWNFSIEPTEREHRGYFKNQKAHLWAVDMVWGKVRQKTFLSLKCLILVKIMSMSYFTKK